MPDTKQQIWKWASKFGKVQTVDFSFVLDAQEKLKKQKKAKIQVLKTAHANKAAKSELDAIKKEIEVFHDALDDMDKKFSLETKDKNGCPLVDKDGKPFGPPDPEMFTGKVFVTFEYIKDKEACVKQYQRGWFKGTFMLDFGLFKCCKEKYKQYCFVYNNQYYPLEVAEADFPSVYLWHNLECSAFRKHAAATFWNIMTLGLIALSWWLIFKLMDGTIENTLLTAILIQVINNVCAQFILFSANYCCFIKVGDKNYNIIWKTILAYFLNTTLAAYLVKMKKFEGGDYDNIWGKQGLTQYVWSLC